MQVGDGEPVVLVPGIQGRWEWLEPTVACLAERYRVIAYSLCDERTSGFRCDPAMGFENYVRQLGDALDRAGLERATVVGVSYGGLIAAEFAARHPGRVTRLVLASALPVDWQPDRRARFYLRAPRLLSPFFVLTAPLRLQPEVRAAIPTPGARARFVAEYSWRALRAPASPARMARRVRWATSHHFADMARVTAPALVVTGEPGLDRVVPVEVSRHAIELLPSARHVVMPRTGHIGIVTRPERFCGVLRSFVAGREDEDTADDGAVREAGAASLLDGRT
jgi:3-oxoadipate enol-lactonase